MKTSMFDELLESMREGALSSVGEEAVPPLRVEAAGVRAIREKALWDV